jgi:hypothetical protein
VFDPSTKELTYKTAEKEVSIFGVLVDILNEGSTFGTARILATGLGGNT